MRNVRLVGIVFLLLLTAAPVYGFTLPEPQATLHTEPLEIQVHFPAIPFNSEVDRGVVAAVESTIAQSVQELIEGMLPFGSVLGTYEIDLDTEHLLSLTLTYSAYRAPMAHPMHYAKSLTFDLQTGRLLTLDDLFGGAYLQTVSAQIKQQIEQKELPLLRPFDGIDASADFRLTQDGVVIYFQLYDLVPYAWGFPQFPISYNDLSEFVRDAYREALLKTE